MTNDNTENTEVLEETEELVDFTPWYPKGLGIERLLELISEK